MNKGLFAKLLPHLVALVIFFVVAFLFCQPAFQGQVLQQHDIIGVKGMIQNSLEYREQFGRLPLWNTHLFGGMPNYQVAVAGPPLIPKFAAILSLGLPEPASFFFIASVCFYILCLCFRINPYIGIFGALAYAYATYNPVILNAGHITKMLAIGYAPALLGGIVLIYEKRYWLGLGVTTFFAAAEITANHPQINYYLLIALGFMTLSYLVIWIQNKEFKHAAIAVSLAVAAALVGVGTSAVTLFTTYEYTKYTMRGGKTIESKGNEVVVNKTTGLDKDYAFKWSLGKSEAVTLFMPNAFGGSSGESFDADSKLVETMVERNIPEASAVQLASSLPKYWGGMSDPTEGTSGPAYLGIISALLFVVGCVVIKSHHRWWLLAGVLFGIMMAWGKYFFGFNSLLFEALPFYDKFRAPSMSLVIPQLLVPIMAVLCLQQLLFTNRESLNPKSFRHVLYALGGLIAFAGLLYVFNDYGSPIDSQIMEAYSARQGGDEIGRTIVSGLKADRKAMFGGDILRLFGFSLLIAGLLFLWMRKVVSPWVVIGVLALVSTIDLVNIGKKYLGEEIYVDPETLTTANFQKTPADEMILQDKDPQFRVFNLTPDRFNESRTAYYHRSVGGYHPAKLRLYQDLIENQLSKQGLNMPVMNMLNTRYFLIPGEQGGAPANVQRNDSALGAAWFVRQVQPVSGPAAEMKALDNFDPAQTAFIDQAAQPLQLPQISPDTTATIRLAHYNNDTIRYQTTAASPQFAVFSEIYYPAGWNAYLDGKKTDYYRVNYMLRGMPVPAGNHTIEFRFEPAVYYNSYRVAFWASILLYLFFFGGIFYSVWERRKEAHRTA